ncbi:type IV secretory pathway VirB2 component (pilin) [Bartonella callosciuri]|uniref:Type IV secretory pathway VirB2 component (Pilin) n=1 Tax=Bartonella callosciuri TaxID=686223 RepID=A0A840NWC5_9HYPH|nr:VirB2 family type IV secretion system major pilin TrwL [Bartonella callosciuri]MBB5074245.1 type IV secretory pathway VirB2 component (pilin) [Bartonella callosciuri]
MKQSHILQTKFHNSKIIATIATITVFFMNHPVYAQAQTLGKAKTALETLQTELGKIIPIAAAIILLCLAIGYAGRYIEKDTFVRWAIGVVIAGSAAEIVAMLFTKA